MVTTQPKFTYSRPPMYPKQLAAMFTTSRMSVIEASTKAGKTVSAIVWLAEMAMKGTAGQNFWWVAPVFAQAKIAYMRMKRRLPPQMIKTNETEMTIHLLPNDVLISFKSGDHPDSLYGQDVYAAVIDEASRVKEEAWHAVRSTLTATRGPVRIIGNVRGRRNWAYKLARAAEKGDLPNASYHKITWRDAVAAKVLDEAEIDDARAVLPESVFKELYEAEPGDDEGNPFGISAIDACAVEYDPSRPVVCYGVDLARKHDYTVIIGLDQYGYVVEFQRFQKPWPDQIRIIREMVGMLPTLVDATGIGDVVVGLLQAPVLRRPQPEESDYHLDESHANYTARMDRLMLGDPLPGDIAPMAEMELEKAFGGTNIEGYMFNGKSKQSLMEGLAVAIQHQNVHFPRYANPSATSAGDREHVLKLELESYEYVYTRTGVRYAAPEGEFDDTVCSLALAVQCLQTRVLPIAANFDLAGMVSGFTQNSLWGMGNKRREGEFDYGRDKEPDGGISLGW